MEVKFQNATPPTNRRHFFPILANVVLIFPPIGRHKTTLRNIGILSFRFLVTFCGYISSNDLICVQGNKLGQNAPGSGLRFFSEFFLPLAISTRYMARFGSQSDLGAQNSRILCILPKYFCSLPPCPLFLFIYFIGRQHEKSCVYQEVQKKNS